LPKPPVAAARGNAGAAVPLGEDQPVRYAGLYLNLRTDATLRIAARNAGLAIEGGPPLVHEGSHQFRVDAQQLKLVFDVPHAGSAQRVKTQRAGGREVVYERVPALPASGLPLGDYAGIYRSAEAGSDWRVVVRDGKLAILRERDGEGMTLTPQFADAFSAPGGWLLRFHRDAAAQVDRLTVSTGRSRRVSFVKDRER
jgi:hypothetical protein